MAKPFYTVSNYNKRNGENYNSMNEATKLWKANLNSDYHSYRNITDKEAGESRTLIKREQGDEWEELP